MRTTTAILTIIVLLIIASAVVLLVPAADPLSNADTVYVEIPGMDTGSETISTIQDQLKIVLNERSLEIVEEPTAADVALKITQLDMNLGDVGFSIHQGEITGSAHAVLVATSNTTGKTYTMDLVLETSDGNMSATLKTRKFYEFWK